MASQRYASENSSITFQSDNNSSQASIMTAAKVIGYKPGKLQNGKHPVTTRKLERKIKQLRIMTRISDKIQDFILQPQNSWVERLDSKESMAVDDINADMDLFFVIKGAVEFTMREDHIQRACKAYQTSLDCSLVTETNFDGSEESKRKSSISFDRSKSQAIRISK